jgi:hypothetical protein
MIEVRSDRKYLAGREVYNEYDSFKNTIQMYSNYGFIMERNLDDYLLINIPKPYM